MKMHILTQHILKSLQDAHMHMDLRCQRPMHALSDLHNWRDILNAYDALDDATSKEVFMKLMALRILYFTIPSEIVQNIFSLYPAKIWQKFNQLAEKIPGVTGDYALDKIETWILKGYECLDCKAESGEIVIDAGAFTGNTVMYFKECVGEHGKVYAFEPMEETFQQLKENVGHFPQVHLVQAGVCHQDGYTLIAPQNFPGASLLKEGDIRVETRTIDSFVEENNMQRLDFLKMDIEGSEMEAIKGAKKTIQKFRPKMALCVYHKPTDIFTIYEKILEFDSKYKFYLKHNSNNLWETVLFCVPTDTKHACAHGKEPYTEDICIAHILRDLYKGIHALATENETLNKRNTLLEDQLRYMLDALKKTT